MPKDSADKIIKDLLKLVKPYKTGMRKIPVGYEILPTDLTELVLRAKELKK